MTFRACGGLIVPFYYVQDCSCSLSALQKIPESVSSHLEKEIAGNELYIYYIFNCFKFLSSYFCTFFPVEPLPLIWLYRWFHWKSNLSQFFSLKHLELLRNGVLNSSCVLLLYSQNGYFEHAKQNSKNVQHSISIKCKWYMSSWPRYNLIPFYFSYLRLIRVYNLVPVAHFHNGWSIRHFLRCE